MNEQRNGRSRSRARTVITTYNNLDRAKALPAASSTPPVGETLVCPTTVPFADTRVNLEPITLAWLDLPSQSTPLIVASLRAVSDFIRIFVDPSACRDELERSRHRIFLILSSGKEDLLVQFHALAAVEAIFILDAKAVPSEHAHPKLVGAFQQHEELIQSLKHALEQYQQLQFETFAFDDEHAFLCLQLWKDEVGSTCSPSFSPRDRLCS